MADDETPDTLLNRLDRIFLTCLGAGFAGLVLIVLYQVVVRMIIRLPAVWTLELAQLVFTWLIFIGAIAAYYKGAHYRVDFVGEGWPRLNALVDLISTVIAGVVSAMLMYAGWLFVLRALPRTNPALGISEAWFYIPLPIFGLAVVIITLSRLGRRLQAVAAAFRR